MADAVNEYSYTNQAVNSSQKSVNLPDALLRCRAGGGRVMRILDVFMPAKELE
jgi:hypothetical protein